MYNDSYFFLFQCGLSSTLLSYSAENGTLLDPVQIRLVQDQLERFIRLNPDPVEFACLKTMVLFNPGWL